MNARREDGPKRDQIGVCARMGLQVCVIRAKEIAGQFCGQALNGIDIVTAGVKPVVGNALGVFVVSKLPIASCAAKEQ